MSKMRSFFLFVLIILYSLYLEYDSPLVPSASGLAGYGGAPLLLPVVPF